MIWPAYIFKIVCPAFYLSLRHNLEKPAATIFSSIVKMQDAGSLEILMPA